MSSLRITNHYEYTNDFNEVLIKINMCLALPGKVVSISGDLAVVDFDGAQKKINLALVDVKKGDFVIVHAGFAIEKLDEKEARETLKAYGK